MLKNQKGFAHLIVLLIVLAAVVGGAFVFIKNHQTKSASAILASNASPEDKAVAAGKALSGDKCNGTDRLTFTHLPMNESDFSINIPYGLVVGGHVTPIDHQYFAPADYNSPRDAYPVYAMAEAKVVDIQPRVRPEGTEYRLVFAHSCTNLYYYDLVTSLTGKVKAAYESHKSVDVKAGDQIGAIGHQTLDFAMWDTHTNLKGFINPAHYDAESWKVFTTDPMPYYTPALRTLVESRNPRIANPIAGKIDYDIDGKLIGNWFTVGSGGYHAQSNKAQNYWAGHLSIAPNLYDPSVFIISIGDWQGQAMQFGALGNTPDPAMVGVDTGMVKYQLVQYSYANGWNQTTVVKDPKVVLNSASQGTLLVQLTSARTLKVEKFPGKTPDQVSAFTSAAQVYER